MTLLDDIRKFLRNWEDSDMLPSEAAEELLRLVAARWQPIETAPKDGTEFLAYDSETGTMDVCYCDGILGVRPVQCDYEYGPGSDEFGYNRDCISHWMPLPDKP